MTAEAMVVGAGGLLLAEAVEGDGKIDGPADAENDHEPVDKAQHVINEAAVFGGVLGLAHPFDIDENESLGFIRGKGEEVFRRR
jgi:hypothetical protein